MKRVQLYLSILLWCVCFNITVMAQEPPQPAPANGQALWSKNCAPCHGVTGQGDGPAAQSITNPLPNFTDPALGRQAVPQVYFEIIKNGRLEKMMPPWKNQLSDQQMADLMGYVLTLSISPTDLITGQTIYQTRCASCHGADGAATDPNVKVQLNDWAFMATQSLSNLQVRYEAETRHTDLKLAETPLITTLAYIRNLSFIVPRTDGILSGQLINGTTQHPLPDWSLQLHIIEDNTEIETRTLTTDSQGRYTVTALSTNPTRQYVLEAQYKDIFYRSPEPASFAPSQAQQQLNLQVYDTTTDPQTLVVPQLHLLISPGPDDIRVIQIFVLGNHGQKTYVGEQGQTFLFALPDQATDINFENDVTGQRFIKTATGYADTEPITPGDESASIFVSYSLPHTGANLEVKIPLFMAVNSVSTLLQERGATLQSNQLQPSSPRSIQGDQFAVYVGQGLKANDTLAFTLGNLNNLTMPATNEATLAPSAMTDQTALLYSTLGMGVLMMILALGVYPYLRPADNATRQQKLLLLLWQLDEAFRSGDLTEAVYRPARARYKAELVSLMEE